jgi:serine/threonine-protein kinase
VAAVAHFDEESQTLRVARESDVSEVRPSRPILPTRQTHDTMLDDDSPVDVLKERSLARIGRVLAERYELLNLLGCGSAGAVYSAMDHVRGERVAVKLLHEGLARSPEHVARFEREARAASSIGHSSVVKVLDIGRDERNCLFLVLELLEGEGLFFAISSGRLTVGDIVEIGRQLLGALAAAHARGIVHRDVKPENLFLAREPSGALRLKLLDFGIAKYLDGDGASSFRTMDGLLIGTPHYMSPQVCMGIEASADADLWAAGAVLYHAFAGEPPFDGDNIGDLLTRIVSSEAPSLATRRPDLPEPVIDAIDRALAKDPAHRWRSALAFSDALHIGAVDIAGLDWDE